MSDDDTNDGYVPLDERRVSEEDAVVQTANGERYRASKICKGSPSPDEDN